jgi:hypothetical protein
MVPVTIIPMIITAHTTILFTAQPSASGSVFGIPFGIMASSDPTTGDIHPITGDTLPIIGEATIHITMGAVMGAAATILIVPPTELISERVNSARAVHTGVLQ